MNPLFQGDIFVIKRKKLSTEKLRVFSDKGDFLMYSEEKITWKPPFTATVRIWADEEKRQELLVATDSGGREYQNFIEVRDSATGESVGGVGLGGGFIKDGWILMDPQGGSLAEVTSGAGRSLLRLATSGAIAQKLEVVMDGQTVATMRQKHALIGKHLRVEIAPQVPAKIDHRLLVAAGVLVAAYLSREDME